MSDDEKGGATPPEPAKEETIIPQVIEEEMKRSYLDYAMSVIVAERCRTSGTASSRSTAGSSTR
jgi:hypothetical protein